MENWLRWHLQNGEPSGPGGGVKSSLFLKRCLPPKLGTDEATKIEEI